jgi:glutathione S-transferase
LKPTRFIESQLAVKPWFAGEQLSMADIQMSFPIFALLARGGIADLPHTSHGKRELKCAWQRAIEQGGPGSPRYVILIAKCCKVAQGR